MVNISDSPCSSSQLFGVLRGDPRENWRRGAVMNRHLMRAPFAFFFFIVDRQAASARQNKTMRALAA